MINYAAQRQKVAGEGCRKEKLILIRMYIVLGICFVGFMVVLARAVYLHMVDNDELKWVADKQYNARIPLSVRRGKIFDRNGAELAVSLPVPSIYVDPMLVEDPLDTASKLSGVLKIQEKDLVEKIKMPRRFVWVKRRISYQTLKKVMSLNLPGVNYVEESKRFYPNGELASQVLGAVGYDSQALGGIEMAYGDALISMKTSTFYDRDARGRLYATPIGFEEQSDVGEIYLTIDKQIQFIAEGALRRAVKEFNAADGMAVVIDPENGEVLAMASAPHFDPNRYSKYPVGNWRNRAVTDAFEPGSTFKVFIVAAALSEGIVNTESVYNCERGSIRVGKNVLRDHHPYADLSVQDIIKYSSNIGALKIAFDLGKGKLFKTLRKFGIGSKTGTDFPGEVGGILRDYETWQPVEHATVAFGQGLTATPLQMAAAFSAAVSNGIYYRPRMVARIVDREGRVTYSEPEVLGHPIRKEVSEIMRYMLRRVVEEGGTGVKAHSDSYSIGGKTGTAQKVGGGGKGYVRGKYFSSFVGFAPVEKPELVVFVGIDEPKGSYYGGTVAAPVVKEIIERSLNYMGVPSARSPVMYTAKGGDESLKSAVDYDLVRGRKAEFKGMGRGRFVMPDLAGLTIREILASAGQANVEAETEGSGVAVLQSPEPGAVIERGGKFSVRFELPR